MNPWDRIKKELEAKLSPESYQNWIGRIDYVGMDGFTLIVSVPDEATKRWIEAEYAAEVLLDGAQVGLGHRSRGIHHSLPAGLRSTSNRAGQFR